jgi:hypothetical protein
MIKEALLNSQKKIRYFSFSEKALLFRGQNKNF